MIEGVDLIVDCLDNFSSRQALNRISIDKGLPLVQAGVSGLETPETLVWNVFLWQNPLWMKWRYWAPLRV